jgi:hypothetical protein
MQGLFSWCDFARGFALPGKRSLLSGELDWQIRSLSALRVKPASVYPGAANLVRPEPDGSVAVAGIDIV